MTTTRRYQLPKTGERELSEYESLLVFLENDQDSVVGVFCGEPHTREVVWTGARYEPFDAKMHRGKHPALRVALNFFIDGEMRLFEGSSTWFKALCRLRDKVGDLEKYCIRVTRHGKAGDMRTTYSFDVAGPITDELATQIKTHPLRSLNFGGDYDE
jgi:hypothetical protein